MSSHGWLSAALIFQTILLTVGNYGRLRKARRNNQLYLTVPLRWQILGHVVLGIGWSLMLAGDLHPFLSDALLLTLFVFLFAAGMAALMYGRRRERGKPYFMTGNSKKGQSDGAG